MSAAVLIDAADIRYLGVIEPAVLGDRLRVARVARGLTQADVAGGYCNPAYLSRIESGDRRPSVELLVAFTARMGLRPRDLLTGQVAAVDDDGQAALVAFLAGRVAEATGAWLDDPRDGLRYVAMTDAVAAWRAQTVPAVPAPQPDAATEPALGLQVGSDAATPPTTDAEEAHVTEIEDGFGSSWATCGPGCDLAVMRPGKVQCNRRSSACPDLPVPGAAGEEQR